MNFYAVTSWLPLFCRELVELANRGTTHLIRVGYCGGLLGIFLLLAYKKLPLTAAPLELVESAGSGRAIFSMLMLIQVFAVALLLPILASEPIVAEKERRGMEALLLTSLRPTSIVLETYLGGLVPVLALLFVNLPMAGTLYALGGLSLTAVAQSVTLLLALVCVISAVSIFASAWCLTVLSAATTSYLLILVFAVAFWKHIPFDALVGVNAMAAWPLTVAMAVTGALTLFFLLMAIWVFNQRALLRPRPVLTSWIRRLSTSLTGTLERVLRRGPSQTELNGAEPLPVEDPVAWREEQIRGVDKVVHVMLMILAFCVPAIVGIYALMWYFEGSHDDLVTAMFVALGIAGVLVATHLAVFCVNTFASDKKNRMLESLMTSPLGSDEIVLQKMRAAIKLSNVYLAPIVLLVLLTWILAAGSLDFSETLLMLFGPLIFYSYLRMISWSSCWFSLAFDSQPLAIILSLIFAVLALLIVPGALVVLSMPVYLFVASMFRGFSLVAADKAFGRKGELTVDRSSEFMLGFLQLIAFGAENPRMLILFFFVAPFICLLFPKFAIFAILIVGPILMIVSGMIARHLGGR